MKNSVPGAVVPWVRSAVVGGFASKVMQTMNEEFAAVADRYLA